MGSELIQEICARWYEREGDVEVVREAAWPHEQRRRASREEIEAKLYEAARQIESRPNFLRWRLHPIAFLAKLKPATTMAEVYAAKERRGRS